MDTASKKPLYLSIHKYSMHRTIIILLIICLNCVLTAPVNAQTGNDHWLGTGYRLDWNNGVPTGSTWDSSGHQAVGLDTNGNLMWYANMYGVFDRRGIRMPNSPNYSDSVASNYYDIYNDFTFAALQFKDSTQKFALIVRAGEKEAPKSDGKYLRQRQPPGYLIIDMNKNEGYGAVVNKAYIPLFPDTLAVDGIGITPHSNGKDFWIVSSGFAYYSNFTTGMKYYVSAQLSSAGLVQRTLFPSFVTGYTSNLVFNNRGTMFLDELQSYGSRFFRFNNSTGDISFYKDLIRTNVFNDAGSGQKARTVFTANDSFLIFYSSTNLKKYFLGKTPPVAEQDAGIYTVPVFNLPDSNSVKRIDDNSIYFRSMDSANGPDLGGWRISDFQFGPDGKLYILHFKLLPGGFTGKGYYYISVLHHPEKNGIDMQLETNILIKRFPNFKNNTALQNITDYFSFRMNQGPFARFEIENLACSTRFINTCPPEFNRFVWYWGDGDSTITNSRAPITHFYRSSDTFTIRLHATGQNGVSAWTWNQAIIKQKPRARFGVTTYTGCQYVGFVITDSTAMAGTGKSPYTWHYSFGDGKDTIIKAKTISNLNHTYFSSGNYNLLLIANNGHCADTFQLNKAVTIKPAARPGISTIMSGICVGNTITLSRKYTDPADSVLWVIQDSFIRLRAPNTGTSYKIKSAGTLKIKQSVYSNTCVTKDSVSIIVFNSFKDTEVPKISSISAKDNKTLILKANKITGARQYLFMKNGLAIGTVKDTIFTLLSSTDWEDTNSYSLLAIDSCGKQSLPSPAHQSLNLSYHWQGDTAILSWNKYTVRTAAIYYIYQATTLPYFSLKDSTVNRAYKIPFANTEPANYCYKIAARTGTRDTAYSNYACIDIQPKVHLPTIFTPNADGLNDTWQPKLYGIPTAAFKIYNRSGLLIYSGQSPGPGWDGYYRGSPCNDGVYLAIVAIPGQKNIRKTFTLIK